MASFEDEENETEVSPTMGQAMEFVDRKADNFEAWRIKGLGLQLVLFGLAEVQAQRMGNLSGLVTLLEKKLLNRDMLRTLEPKQIFALYRMSTEALTEASGFVERTVKNINWKEIEAQLLEVSAADATTEGDVTVAAAADDLLAILSRASSETQSDNESEI